MTAVIDVAPSKASVGRKARFKPLRSLLGFLWRHKLRLAAATVALVATALLQLSLGYGVQILIDDGFASADQAGLRRAIGFILAVGFGMAVGAMTRFYLVSWLGERVSA